MPRWPAFTDPDADPDRRAWHLAEAAAGPDERSPPSSNAPPSRAQARGGLAAAAAFLERAAALTPDPLRRAERTLAAAQANLQAGDVRQGPDLMALAEAGPMDEFQAARADLLRGRIAFASGLGSDAPPLLLKAAKRLEPLNLDLARETYVDAWQAAFFAGHLAGAGDLLEVSRAARVLPPASTSAASGRPGAGRFCAAGHRRADRRCTAVAAGHECLYQPRHPRGTDTPVGLCRHGGGRSSLGRRRLARDRQAGSARP